MTTETDKKPDKIAGVLGALFGVFLYCLWVAALMAILFVFFAEPNAMGVFVVRFPHMIQTWLTAGVLPLFITLGYYLFSRKDMPGTEFLPNRSGLAASASGFLLWLAVLAVLEVWGSPWRIPITSPVVMSSC